MAPSVGTHETRGLPNLVIIGALKCGTSSLHEYLDAHPEIAMSSVKELNFFLPGKLPGATWSRGLDWYRAQFDATARVRGESSTNYTARPPAERVAERMRGVLDDVRLIYLVRDPFERMRSHYDHNRVAGVERRSIADALGDPDNPYLRASLYATQVEAFVERFGSDRVLVETQESLLTDRQSSLQRVFRFLGVDDQVERPEFEKTWNRSTGKGWGYRLARGLAERGIRPPASLRWHAQRLLRSPMLGGGKRREPPPVIEGTLRAALAPRLEEEANSLRLMTGKSLEEWSV